MDEGLQLVMMNLMKTFKQQISMEERSSLIVRDKYEAVEFGVD